MITLYRRLEAIFFQPISASGFGLMRIAWGLTVFVNYLFEWFDIDRYYSDAGLLPLSLEHLVQRAELRFSLFDYVTDPTAVFGIYLLFLAASLAAMIGYRPRLSVAVTLLLLTSFHERNFLPLAGGETVMRVIGFILLIAPGIDAFSIGRLRAQWKHWRTVRALLPPKQMPAWPRILLLWQLTIIYLYSAWDKFYGDMWRAGTVIASVLHHPHFARFPLEWMYRVSQFTRPLTYAAIAWELSWLLLYVPRVITNKIPYYDRNVVRRTILVGGIFFHGLIHIFLEVGSFSMAMLSAYFGLLLANDFDAIRRYFNRKWRGKIAVLYDGRCGLCQRSMFWLLILDHLHRLHAVNFRDAAARRPIAPDLLEEDLDRTMHIRLPDGHTEKGFYAFRELARHLPLLWIAYPFLFIKPIEWTGKRMYEGISERRERCNHDSCNL